MDKQENRKRKADEIAVPVEEEAAAADAATPEQDDGITLNKNGEEVTKKAKVTSESSSGQVIGDEKDSAEEDTDEKEEETTQEKTADPSSSNDKASEKDEKTTPESFTKDDNKEQEKPKEETKSVFGATTGFAGFGAVKTGGGFGFGNNKTEGTSAFGSSGGFGSSTKGTSAFGGFAAGVAPSFGSSSGLSFGTAKGFGELQPTKGTSGSAFGATGSSPSKKSNDEEAADDSVSPAPLPTRPIVELPTNYELRSGEEEETVLFEGRCRTRRLAPEEEEPKDPASTGPGLAAKAAPAVPHSEILVRNTAASSQSSSATPLVTWQDVGTGPLKVLQHKSTGKFRVVQRREVSPSGPATKVILNVPAHVGGLSKIPPAQEEEIETRQRFQWTTPVEGKAVTYLFKFSSTQEARELVKVLDGTEDPKGAGAASTKDDE